MKQVTIPVYEYTELTQSARDKAYWPLAEELMGFEYNELEYNYKEVGGKAQEVSDLTDDFKQIVRFTDFVKIGNEIGHVYAMEIVERVVKKKFFLEIDLDNLEDLIRGVFDRLNEEIGNRDYTDEVIDHCQANDLLFYEDGSPCVAPRKETSCTAKSFG